MTDKVLQAALEGKEMRRRFLLVVAILFGTMMFGSFVVPAGACPLCKNANETEPNLPKAYMYSILFMLAMPATVFTGFGIGFYRLSRKQQELLAAEDESVVEEFTDEQS